MAYAAGWITDRTSQNNYSQHPLNGVHMSPSRFLLYILSDFVDASSELSSHQSFAFGW